MIGTAMLVFVQDELNKTLTTHQKNPNNRACKLR